MYLIKLVIGFLILWRVEIVIVSSSSYLYKLDFFFDKEHISPPEEILVPEKIVSNVSSVEKEPLSKFQPAGALCNLNPPLGIRHN